MTNKLLLFSVACGCNLVLPTYYDPPLLLINQGRIKAQAN